MPSKPRRHKRTKHAWNPHVYIVAIAWIYVTLLVSVMQPTVFRGVVTFLGVGLGPLALLLWLVGTPARRRRRERQEPMESADSTDSVKPGAAAPGAPEDAARLPRESGKPGD
jgi:hypothetical protein